MRRIVYAPSFDREVEDIAVYIEEQFGERVRREFIADLAKLCQNVASFPALALPTTATQLRALQLCFVKIGFSSIMMMKKSSSYKLLMPAGTSQTSISAATGRM